MGVEENKALVQRFREEGWNQQNPDVFDELLDDHYAAVERNAAAWLWAAYPDSHFDLIETIAEGDKVVTRLLWTGTHRGEFWGVPPTGKTMTVDGIFIYRVAGDRITWEGRFGLIDFHSWRQQLGLNPSETYDVS